VNSKAPTPIVGKTSREFFEQVGAAAMAAVAIGIIPASGPAPHPQTMKRRHCHSDRSEESRQTGSRREPDASTLGMTSGAGTTPRLVSCTRRNVPGGRSYCIQEIIDVL
jgi:hypothetical protein